MPLFLVHCVLTIATLSTLIELTSSTALPFSVIKIVVEIDSVTLSIFELAVDKFTFYYFIVLAFFTVVHRCY